jgi:ketosteroid isomerase-like protein
MTEPSPAERLAIEYFQAWRAHDIDRVAPLLADNVDFVGALGTAQGAQQALAGLRGMFAMTKTVEIIHRWIDGPDVITWFELTTASAGPLAIVNWSHVTRDKIDRIRVTFDPRPLLA